MSDTTRSDGPRVDRRTVLRAAGGLTAATAFPAAAVPVAAGEAGDDAAAEWFDGVGNYDGTVADERGNSEVTVSVGAQGNGGAFAFDPPAVRIDPGTSVVWEWTGEGGSHNVVAADGSFESPAGSEKGRTFSRAFEESGVVRYACAPHESMGMRGALLVGDEVSVGSGSGHGSDESDDAPDGDWFGNVDNFDGVVDRTGRATVEVTVGAPGNGGHFAFDPPAVRVDPGTTVVWRWRTGENVHHVVAVDDSFWSPRGGAADGTFERTFEAPGVVRYACPTYRALGMKGAVMVGGGTTSGDIAAPLADRSPVELAVGGSLLAALVSPLAFGAILARNGTGDDASAPDPAPGDQRP